MQNDRIINYLTIYPSKAWADWYKSRNIFSCDYEDLNTGIFSKESQENRDTQLQIICHCVQNLGDLKLKLLSVKLKKHIYSTHHWKSVNRSSMGSEFKRHDDRLLNIANNLFMEIYRYIGNIKVRYEELYHCILKLEPPKVVFERFICFYFTDTVPNTGMTEAGEAHE